MEKVNLSRRLITKNSKEVYPNVVELVIQNYSTTAIDIVVSNIVTQIPPSQKVLGVDVPSMPYRINAVGNIIENLTFDIIFPTGSGKVIIDCTSTGKKC
jgi:hypothetical protein